MDKDDFFGCVGAVWVAIVVIAAVALLLALPTFYLWNWLMPYLFGLPTVTFWQALGINVLSSILFKSSYSSGNKSK